MEIEVGKEYLVDFHNPPFFKQGDVFLVCKRHVAHFIIQFDHGEIEEIRPEDLQNTKLTEVKSF